MKLTNNINFKNKKPSGFTLGFTLIEMLVVISIIGVLAALSVVSFTSSQKQARDTKRKSDLKFYQNGLETYANNNNGLYPMWSSGLNAAGTQFCSGSLATSNCPTDPKYTTDNSYYYHYQSDGSLNSGAATATKYILWSKIENTSGYWVVCSSGSTFSSTSQPNISTCP